MGWQDITDFFSQLFTSLTVTDSLVLLLALLGAYLIGWLFTRLYYRNKLKKHRVEEIEKDKMIAELKITEENLTAELELKTADLKKAELAMNNLQSEYQVYATEKEQLLQAQNDLQRKLEELQTQLEATNAGEVKNTRDSEIIKGSVRETNPLFDPVELQTLLNQTDQRIAALESRIRELENEEREIIIVDAEDLEEAEEESENYFAEARVEEAKKIINKALGKNILKANASEKDDLKRINGVGPFIEQKLNELGIYTYEQVSQFDAEFIQSLTEAIQFFPGRIERDDWVGQAKKLM